MCYCILIHLLTTYYLRVMQSLDPGIFNSQGIYPQPTNAPYLTGKEVWNISENLLIFTLNDTCLHKFDLGSPFDCYPL